MRDASLREGPPVNLSQKFKPFLMRHGRLVNGFNSCLRRL
jgi:hypothetical protein